MSFITDTAQRILEARGKRVTNVSDPPDPTEARLVLAALGAHVEMPGETPDLSRAIGVVRANGFLALAPGAPIPLDLALASVKAASLRVIPEAKRRIPALMSIWMPKDKRALARRIVEADETNVVYEEVERPENPPQKIKLPSWHAWRRTAQAKRKTD